MPNPLMIIVESSSIEIGGVMFPTAPTCDRLRVALGSAVARQFQKAPDYLPTLIFDSLGLIARYERETTLVRLLHVYFATSRSVAEPSDPYGGAIRINDREIMRPLLLKDFPITGTFRFNNGAAATSAISASVYAKFEYVGIVDLGWRLGVL